MILLLLAISIIFFFYKISDKECGFFYYLFCPRTKTIDGSPLRNSIAISKNQTYFKNTFDLWNCTPENQFPMFQKYAKEYDSSYLWHAPFLTVYNITKADDLQELLKHSDYLSKGRVYEFNRSLLGDGIVISKGEKWKLSRKIIGQYFHQSFYRNSIEPLEYETDSFIKKLELYEGRNVNLQSELAHFILNLFCTVVLGGEVDSTTYLGHMQDIDNMLSERYGKFIMYLDFIYNTFGRGREFLKSNKDVKKLTSNMVQDRKEKMNKPPKGLLDHLLNSGLDDQTICDEIDNMLLAGFDTTSTAMSFILLRLGLDDEIQQKAYLEISNQETTDYNNLEYLECVIKEGLRLYPSAPRVHRTVTKNIECGNLILAKNTEVSINIFDIHRDSKYFTDPETFEPERFFAANIRDRNPYVHIPFWFGTRICLGRKFAILQMKIVLTKILRNFRIVPVSSEDDIKFKAGFLLRSWEDFHVRFVTRN